MQAVPEVKASPSEGFGSAGFLERVADPGQLRPLVTQTHSDRVAANRAEVPPGASGQIGVRDPTDLGALGRGDRIEGGDCVEARSRAHLDDHQDLFIHTHEVDLAASEAQITGDDT